MTVSVWLCLNTFLGNEGTLFLHCETVSCTRHALYKHFVSSNQFSDMHVCLFVSSSAVYSQIMFGCSGTQSWLWNFAYMSNNHGGLYAAFTNVLPIHVNLKDSFCFFNSQKVWNVTWKQHHYFIHNGIIFKRVKICSKQIYCMFFTGALKEISQNLRSHFMFFYCCIVHFI